VALSPSCASEICCETLAEEIGDLSPIELFVQSCCHRSQRRFRSLQRGRIAILRSQTTFLQLHLPRRELPGMSLKHSHRQNGWFSSAKKRFLHKWTSRGFTHSAQDRDAEAYDDIVARGCYKSIDGENVVKPHWQYQGLNRTINGPRT
jgi:hypothetical protein